MQQLEQNQVNLQGYKAVLLVVTAVLALLAASPALQRLLVYPQTEFFTEMWLLGPGHSAENYPANITDNQDYSVFLGIGNHLGQCAYYVVEVKFRNETMSQPNTFTRTPSSLTALYSMPVFVADKETWEQRLTFSFDYGFDAALSRVEFNSLVLSGVTLNLRGVSSEWNATTSRFYGNLIFELWIYSESASSFQYHQRFVDLKFNMTRSGFS
jgi:hypothetical protein